jgi:hypothetical protein
VFRANKGLLKLLRNGAVSVRDYGDLRQAITDLAVQNKVSIQSMSFVCSIVAWITPSPIRLPNSPMGTNCYWSIEEPTRSMNVRVFCCSNCVV